MSNCLEVRRVGRNRWGPGGSYKQIKACNTVVNKAPTIRNEHDRGQHMPFNNNNISCLSVQTKNINWQIPFVNKIDTSIFSFLQETHPIICVRLKG